ncbi:hypothetical protein WN55_00373 [Dufourea novaeangliae]|uniref:Uncharacterized protein n=1 Tax=Dufourea novaeangliae TaxID=178035 RepID=A0A154PFK5_DUFNO|nr:hypothetical protein WN55_00373 [Dufourea novaeangliae]
MAQNNNNIKYDNNMENNEELLLTLSKLTEVNLIKKVTDNSAAISTNVKDNRLSVEVAKKEVQKHERPVKHPIIFEIPVSTKQHTTVEHSDKVQQKTSNKNLAENKSRSKKNQVIVLNYDSDVNSTCSTVALYPIMRKDNKRSHKYKGSNVKGTVHQNTDCTILKSPILKDTGLKEKVNSKTQPDTVYHCNSNETVIITNNKQCNPNEQDLHNDSTIIYQVDQDALSECSCASTVYSPDHVSVDTTNLRSEYLSKFNQISKQNACNMDQKLLMSCKVLVENIDKNTKIS